MPKCKLVTGYIILEGCTLWALHNPPLYEDINFFDFSNSIVTERLLPFFLWRNSAATYFPPMEIKEFSPTLTLSLTVFSKFLKLSLT